jgi:hypothetical protein
MNQDQIGVQYNKKKIGIIMLIYGKTLNDYLELAKAHKKGTAVAVIIVIAVLYCIF